MVPIQQAEVRNRLLKALSPGDFELLGPHLRLTRAPSRAVMIKANAAIEHLYFPERGFTSVTMQSKVGQIEVGMIGREGLVGASPILLGVNRSPYCSFVQMEGENLQISVQDLRKAVLDSGTLQGLLLRYLQSFLIQTAQTAFANAAFDIEIRVARWLLMCHDRAEGDGMNVTHESLSIMLGVRRPGVTIAIQMLEGSRFIKATRGHIRMMDREGLERAAADSYGLAETEYAHLIAPETLLVRTA